MKKPFAATSLLSLCFVAGCSTTPVRPAIDKFADSVAGAAEAGTASFENSNLDARVADAMRRQLASHGGKYILDAGGTKPCLPVSPLLFATEPAPSFDDVCGIRSVSLDAKGDVIDISLGPPRVSANDAGNGESLSPEQRAGLEFNARRSLVVLKDYASAIGDLATSEDPEAVATAAANAIAALGTAANAAKKLSGESIPEAKMVVISSGGSLIENLTREALEARRYDLLAGIVRDSDPIVEQLARATADWFYMVEEPSLLDRYANLRQTAVTSEPGDIADMVAVENAESAVRQAEAEAHWKVFWQIGAAHHAILESFEQPADFEQLLAANTRIQNLVKSVQAFMAALGATEEQ